jgi:hypothetical protein
VQNVADAVATVALARAASWNYSLPKMEHPVTTIAIGLDGTCLLTCEDGCQAGAEAAESLAQVCPRAKADEDVRRAITYFTNQAGAGRMDHAPRAAVHEPIGGGVTEGACKVLIKRRLCGCANLNIAIFTFCPGGVVEQAVA